MSRANLRPSTPDFARTQWPNPARAASSPQATIYQVPEVRSYTSRSSEFYLFTFLPLLPDASPGGSHEDVRPPKPDYPIATAADLLHYDGFLIGYVKGVASDVPLLSNGHK